MYVAGTTTKAIVFYECGGKLIAHALENHCDYDCAVLLNAPETPDNIRLLVLRAMEAMNFKP